MILIFLFNQALYPAKIWSDFELTSEMFLTLAELKYVVDRWRMDYNHYRPHSSFKMGQINIAIEKNRRKHNRPRKSLGNLTPNEVFYKRKKLTG